jgi:hypothetical protein
MDLTKVLAQLHAELANLDAAIESLERLKKEGRRRGRPPKALSDLKRSIKSEEQHHGKSE